MDNPIINKSDDGSWAVEWIFPDCRFALCLDANIEQSGWYIVYGKGDKMFLENGALPPHFNQVLYDVLEKTQVKPDDIEWATAEIDRLHLA